MRYFIGIVVLALALAITLPAIAETQNVKVSGEITSRVVKRYNLCTSNSLDKDQDLDTNFFMTNIAVQIDADLTDNVATVIRLAQQRDWNSASSTTNEYDVLVDLAYVVLKEMVYAPLTVIIGRQDLKFGNGFVIGENRIDPNSQISADEYSEFTAFDAIRAILDYDPWTIDLVYAKIDENSITNNNDIDLYGANVGYMFDRYNAEMEAYWWYYHDSSIVAAGSPKVNDANTIHTLGIRGSMDPVENLNVQAEGAMQFGDYVTNSATEKRDREAWAANVLADYTWADLSWQPVLGGQYVYFSGNDVSNTSGDYKGWDNMYRSTVYGDIANWLGSLYPTVAYGSSQDSLRSINNNRHIFNVYGQITPMEGVIIDANYYNFRLAKKISSTNTSKDFGDEVDVRITWLYTDDVTFDVLGAIFWPGNCYPDNQDDRAGKIVGTCKVEF